MDHSKLKRNGVALKEIGDTLVVLKDTSLQVPAVFLDKELIVLGDRKYVPGTFALIQGDSYAVLSAMASYEINPRKTTKVVVDGQSYYEFTFLKGDVMIKDLNTIQNGDMVYEIFNVYKFQGKMPWYYGPGDITNLLSSSGKYADLDVDSTPEVMEILEAFMSRLDTDTNKMVKSLQSWSEMRKRVRYVPLKNVAYLSNTMAMITGNYQSKGLLNTLTKTPNEVGTLEAIARS